MDIRQLALENFLNDKVLKIKLGLYQWGGCHYEVLPISQIKKRGYVMSHFIKMNYGKTKLVFRELSVQVLNKYYFTEPQTIKLLKRDIKGNYKVKVKKGSLAIDR